MVDGLLESDDLITLKQAIDRTIDRMGSFGLDLDLAYPLSGNLEDRRKKGTVEVVDGINPVE